MLHISCYIPCYISYYISHCISYYLHCLKFETIFFSSQLCCFSKICFDSFIAMRFSFIFSERDFWDSTYTTLIKDLSKIYACS